MNDFIRGVLMNEEILDSRIYWEQLNPKDYALAITSWKAYHNLTRDILRRRSYPFTPDTFTFGFICNYLRCTYKHQTATLAIGCLLEKDCVLGRNSVLGTNTTITGSVITDDCIIGSNVTIRDSYVFSKVKIEDNCTITNSILFSNCVIGDGSRIDGCILCPGIDVVARDEYVDTIVESTASGPPSRTKMSELDINDEFSYFKPNANVTENESNDCTDESSSAETGSAERDDSPDPDDTNMFLSEVIDSLLRGYQDKINCENLILEINSSRYAYNITIREVTYNVVKAILSLPLHYLSETKTPVSNQTYQKTLKVMIVYFNAIILNYIKNEDAQYDCLRAIEDVACTTDELLPYVQHLLHQFYGRDILSEEKILEWYESNESGEDALRDKVKNAVQPFIKWLREAEEGSTESD